MNAYESWKLRRAEEQEVLAKAVDSDARKRVESRIATLNALIADYQSKYNVPVACVCLR